MRLRVLLTLAAVPLVLGGCSVSAAHLQGEAEGKPGVIRVRVGEEDGEADIPFSTIPKNVKIWMKADASAENVMAVFDAYDDETDGDDLVSVDVTLDGPKKATLSAGQGIHVNQQMVDDLVDAQRDETILEYLREAHPVLPGVSIVLAHADFDEVVAVADRYRDAKDIEDVTVVSGDFSLGRDEGNEDLRITDARQDLAHRVDARFGLHGAEVGGRIALQMTVRRSDVPAVRRMVAHNPDARLIGKVIVLGTRSRKAS